MQSHILRIALFLALIGLLPHAAETRAEADFVAMFESGKESVRIVCFGDSVTGVYYHTGGRRAWSDMLGIALGKAYPQATIKMFNAGVSGNTTSAGLVRIDRDVIAHRPHLVVVMFGLNDICKGSPQPYRDNLKTIVDRCRRAGAVVVLCTPNSVYKNPRRPMSAVKEFSQIARDTAQELSAPVADCFGVFEDVRGKNVTEWMLMMSDEIHPSMEGHKRFAEIMAETISGKKVSLADVPPPADSFRFTIARLNAGKPVKVIAAAPYDAMITGVLQELFPEAQVHVTAWPMQGHSLSAIAEWSQTIRQQEPNLVIPAVPANADVLNEESFIQQYRSVLSASMSYARAAWDVVPVMPSVTAPLAPEEAHRAELARRIVVGCDMECLERKSNDQRSSRQLLLESIRQKLQPTLRHEP